MKLRITLLFTLILAFSALVNAQSEIPEEKRKLLVELSVLMNSESHMKEGMISTLSFLAETFPTTFKALIENDKSIPANRKSKIVKDIQESSKSFVENYKEKILVRLDFKSIAEELVVEVYNKNYTTDELKDLVAFYKTSAGRKTIELAPQIMKDSMRYGAEKLLPKLQAISEEVMKEELEKLRQEKP